jgi:hypothetical protein
MNTENKCGFTGKLPSGGESVLCDSCHKLRTIGKIARCRYAGPRIEGLGDVVAKVTRATGIAQAVEFVTGGDCGCPGRQAALNRLVPFGGDATPDTSPP